MMWYSGDLTLTLLILSGVVAIGGVLAVVGILLLRSGQPIGMLAGSSLRLAMAGIRRRQRENLVQVMTFGLAIMLLLLIFLVRTSLLSEWQQQIPEDAPNHYALNIAPDELPRARAPAQSIRNQAFTGLPNDSRENHGGQWC